MSAQPSLFDALPEEEDDDYPIVLEYGSPEFEAWVRELWDMSTVVQCSEWRCAWPREKARGKKL